MIPEFYNNWHVSLQLVLFIIALVIGIFLLIKASDIMITMASSIAKKLKIPPIIIGLTVVAIGTSFPELSVSVFDGVEALIKHSNASVALGNVIGSNICNILVVLGISIIIRPVFIPKSTHKRDMPIMLIASLLLVCFVILFSSTSILKNYTVLRWEGGILSLLMVSYIVYTCINARKERESQEQLAPHEIKVKTWVAVVVMILAMGGVALGGEAVVFGAKGLALKGATALKVDKDLASSLVGLTVVAIGTSLPELVTSIVASKKGENDIAVGNIVGSNIFNILMVIGISSTVAPLSAGSEVVVDVLFMFAVSVLLFGLSFSGKLGRKSGILFVSLYACYLTYLILRTLGVL